MEYFLCFMAGFVALGLIISHKDAPDPNLKRLEYSNGSMSKLSYGDHTFIGWSTNLGGGIVHDPDCKCNKK